MTQTKHRTMAVSGTCFGEFKVWSDLTENVLYNCYHEEEGWEFCSILWMRKIRAKWGRWLVQNKQPIKTPGAWLLHVETLGYPNQRAKYEALGPMKSLFFLRNAPVYCMDGGRWGTRQPCTGVVVPDRLDNTGNDRTEHADDTSRRDGGQSPLN